MKTLRVLACLLIATSLSAKPAVKRPKILGIADVSYFVSDLAKSRAFYEDFLGYQEAFTLPNWRRAVAMASARGIPPATISSTFSSRCSRISSEMSS
jgi:catechol-2,3-dioxygenase